ncbi:dual specificity protein phosphatase family protein [Candidatus Thiodiazotropha sp. LNASS1]|uniref:phosphatase domain-containing putative toxin n=1 Tax=Candidatus Thiodiazotropha sp. LNASS1 TaxID=3096260 RepID=UPI0034E02F53
MSTHPYDILALPKQGRLIFTPCPGTKCVDLTTSVSELHQAGADAIVTMMTNEELANFEVSSLPDVVRQNGMTWFHFPVEDDAAPAEDFEQSWQASKPDVLALIEQGKCVAIHCRGGSGRTGFMAAVIMREMGMDQAQATDMVKGLRPNSLKLPAHIEYLAAHYDKK